MSNLVPPHGGKGLTCCLLEGADREAELKKAEGLKKIPVSPVIINTPLQVVFTKA